MYKNFIKSKFENLKTDLAINNMIAKVCLNEYKKLKFYQVVKKLKYQKLLSNIYKKNKSIEKEIHFLKINFLTIEAVRIFSNLFIRKDS